ncbi:MAG: hypothetical protein AAGN82_24855 [Myxococcota bacterium]
MPQRSILFVATAAATFVGGVATGCGDDVLENGGVGGGGTATSSSIATGGGSAVSSTTSGGPVAIECTDPQSTNLTQDECSLYDPSTCTGPAMACVGQNDGTTRCAFGAGVKEAQEPCESSNECKPGLLCVFNKCGPPCCRETNEPCGIGECLTQIDFGPSGFAHYCSYPDVCTPLGSDCDDNQICVVRFALGNAICVDPAANNPVGSSCNFANDCAENLNCDGSICRYLCFTDGSTSPPGQGGCPQGQTCVDRAGVDGIGVCI